MTDALRCYRCGQSLAALSLPLSRRDECPQCGCELQVCRMCEYYDPRLPNACAEDDALEVKDKTRANFCDYFKPSSNAYAPAELDAEAAGSGIERADRIGRDFGERVDFDVAAASGGDPGGRADAGFDDAVSWHGHAGRRQRCRRHQP